MTAPESRLARLEERSESILRELQRVSRQVDAFGPIAGDVIKVVAEVTGFAKDLHEIRDELIRETEQAEREHERLRAEIREGREERQRLRAEIDTSRTQRQAMSIPLKVALVSGCFGLVGTLLLILAHST